MRAGDGSSAHRPIGVVSAVIVDETRERLLLGVRRPSALVTRHPGVLSTPTMRVPPGTFAELTAGCPDPAGVVGMHPVGGPALDVGLGGHIWSEHSFVLEALLARKLGLGDAISDGRFHAVAHRRFLSLDDVGDPLGTERSEWTAMLTYEVRVRTGDDAIPAMTSSYSRLVWVDPAKVPRALAHHDVLMLDETLNAVEVCIQGLCVRVAAELLTGDPQRPPPAPGGGRQDH